MYKLIAIEEKNGCVLDLYEDRKFTNINSIIGFNNLEFIRTYSTVDAKHFRNLPKLTDLVLMRSDKCVDNIIIVGCPRLLSFRMEVMGYGYVVNACIIHMHLQIYYKILRWLGRAKRSLLQKKIDAISDSININYDVICIIASYDT